ncbi:MAG: MarR family transcriptional regulator [Lachnospiraceae bacterium]|nr:MarR family transcriptional regulator [Lachnospiraceae bacterium]
MEHTEDLRKEVICSMLRVYQRQKHIIENMLSCEKIGIYPAQHRLLMELANDSEISQKELSKRLHVSPATVTISIKKLVRDGYVKKTSLKDDNRYNMIAITDKGKKIIEKSVRIFDAADEKILAGFSDEELDRLNDMFIRMYDNLKD